MATADRLLEAVLERPTDPSVLMVYGDALQARGDPRGALVSVQHQRQLATTEQRRRLLKLQEQQLLEGHRAELLGPVAAIKNLSVTWRLGFARELRAPIFRGELDLVAAALATPTFALLERLELQLLRVSDVQPLLEALPGRLEHLSLHGSDFHWEPLLEALPPLQSLELWGGRPVDFEGLELPELVRLRVATGFDHLTATTAPKLELLTLGDGRYVEEIPELPEGLRLVRLLGESFDALELGTQLRVVREWNPDRTLWDHSVDADSVSRGGWGFAGERAFLLTAASAPQVDDAFAELGDLGGRHFELRTALVPVGPLRLTAVELRVRQPLKALLADFGQAIARRAPAIEVAASNSNRDTLLRAYRGAGVEPLAMGPYKSREAVWRAGVDHAFGFDPGHTLDLVLEALDAERPRAALGDPTDGTRGEWPCATPLPPHEDPREYDDYGDEYEDDETVLPDWWSEQLPEPTEPDLDAPPQAVNEAVEADLHTEELEEGGEHEPDGDAHWAEVMAETPIDLEDDGSERNPEEGLEDQGFDPETVQTESLEACFRCGRSDLPVDECEACDREVCPRCASLENDRLRCQACLP